MAINWHKIYFLENLVLFYFQRRRSSEDVCPADMSHMFVHNRCQRLGLMRSEPRSDEVTLPNT